MKYSNITETEAEAMLAKLLEPRKSKDVAHALLAGIRRAYFEDDYQGVLDFASILDMKQYQEKYFPEAWMVLVAREEVNLYCRSFDIQSANQFKQGRMDDELEKSYIEHLKECEVCRHHAFITDITFIYETWCEAYIQKNTEILNQLHRLRQKPEFTLDNYLTLAFFWLRKACSNQQWEEVLRLNNNMEILNYDKGVFPITTLVEIAEKEISRKE